MPVIQVFAQQFADVPTKLEAVCRAVADELGLRPVDVVATFVAVTETVVPGQRSPSWPVVVVHGSARRPEQMRQACDRIRALAASWSAGSDGDAWVTWQLPG